MFAERMKYDEKIMKEWIEEKIKNEGCRENERRDEKW